MLGSSSSTKGKPVEFRTRRGNRVFRACYLYDGKRRYSENYTIRIKRAGRQALFNIGTDKRKAAELADQISSFLSIRENSIDQAIERFSQSMRKQTKTAVGCPRTVGDFCARYAEIAKHLSPVTVRDNLQALRRIAGFIAKQKPLKRKPNAKDMLKWTNIVNAVPLEDITPQRLEAFRLSMITAAGTDHLNRARAITSSNTYLRSAGSMFSEKWHALLGRLDPANENPFKKVRALPEVPHRYSSDVDPQSLLQQARKDLRDADPACFIIFLLGLVCGMRRGEIDRLVWEQVDLANRHIWIKTTPYFRPKARNSENRIDAPSIVFDELARFKPLSITPPFVIPGSANLAQQVRCKPTFRRLTDWLHRQGIQKTNALHVLRKEAGSLIFQSSGSIDLAAEFLRNDPRVAREHYIGRKGRLQILIPGIDLG